MPKDRRRAEHSDLTAEQRSERAKRAAVARWDKTPYGRTAATQPARDGLERRFEKVADPEGILSPAELHRRVVKLQSRYYSDLAKKRSQRPSS